MVASIFQQLQCNSDTKLLNLENLPSFFCKIWDYWHSYNKLSGSKTTDIKQEMLWNNTNILIQNSF